MDIVEFEMEKLIKAQGYLGEVILALTIPSVCSRYLYGKKDENVRYAKWYNEYVDFPALDGNECYALRCSLLHEGNDNLEKQPSFYNNHSIVNQIVDFELFIPSDNENYTMKYLNGGNPYEKSFCAAALSLRIMDGYKKFKQDNPYFKYPLDRK